MANVWDKAYYDRVIVPQAKAHYVTRTKRDKKYLTFLKWTNRIVGTATVLMILKVVLLYFGIIL